MSRRQRLKHVQKTQENPLDLAVVFLDELHLLVVERSASSEKVESIQHVCFHHEVQLGSELLQNGQLLMLAVCPPESGDDFGLLQHLLKNLLFALFSGYIYAWLQGLHLLQVLKRLDFSPVLLLLRDICQGALLKLFLVREVELLAFFVSRYLNTVH